MTIFNKVSGTYEEVVGRIGMSVEMSSAMITQMTMTKYLDYIDRDLDRTPCVSFGGPISELTRQLRDTTHLLGQHFSYTQGDFDGGGIVKIPLAHQFPAAMEAACKERTLEADLTDNLRIAYIDDTGALCAFSIIYLRQDPKEGEPPVLVADRKRPFVISHIKNTTATVAKRQVTYLTHPLLTQPGSVLDPLGVSEQNLPAEVARLVNCGRLNQLLSELFVGDTLSLPHFKALSARIKSKQNIDNRDMKSEQLVELIRIADKYLTRDEGFTAFLGNLRGRIQTDANFFRQDSFEQTLDDFITQFDQGLKQKPTVSPRASYEVQLTLNAIKLELLSENKNGREKSALKRQAEQLRAMRDNADSRIEAIDYPQLEKLSLGVMAELEETIADYEEELTNLSSKTPNFPILSNFKSHSETLLAQVKQAAFPSTGLLEEAALREHMNTLTCCLNILRDPGNQANQAALGELQDKYQSIQPLGAFIDSFATNDLNNIQAAYLLSDTLTEFQKRLAKISLSSSKFIRDFHDDTKRLIEKATSTTKGRRLLTAELTDLNRQLLACSELLVRPENKEAAVIPIAAGQEEVVQTFLGLDFAHLSNILQAQTKVREFRDLLDSVHNVTKQQKDLLGQANDIASSLHYLERNDFHDLNTNTLTFISDCATLINGRTINEQKLATYVQTHAKKFQALELMQVAEHHVANDTTFIGFIQALRERIQTEVDFFSDASLQDTMTDVVTQFEAMLSRQGNNPRARYEVQLTHNAIKLELLLESRTGDDKLFQQAALRTKASKLRGLRNFSTTPITQINYVADEAEALSLVMISAEEFKDITVRYHRQLNKIPLDTRYEAISAFHSKAQALLSTIKGLAGNAPESVGEARLQQLLFILKRGLDILDNPSTQTTAIRELQTQQLLQGNETLQASIQALTAIDYGQEGLLKLAIAKNNNKFKEQLRLMDDTNDADKKELAKQGRKVLAELTSVQSKKTSITDLSMLNNVLNTSLALLDTPNDMAKVRELTVLSQTLSGKASPALKGLGYSLLAFVAAALVVAGVLFCIPSGGTSLLATLAGLTGLSLLTSAGIGAGAVGLTAAVGGLSLQVGKDKGLARETRKFGSMFCTAKKATVVRASETASTEDSAPVTEGTTSPGM